MLIFCKFKISNYVKPHTFFRIFTLTAKDVPFYCRLNIFLLLIFSLHRIKHVSRIVYQWKNLNMIGYQAYNNVCLKLVSAISCQISIFSPNDSPSETMKIFFISSKKLFLFSRYSIFCNFFPFPYFPDSKEQMEVE